MATGARRGPPRLLLRRAVGGFSPAVISARKTHGLLNVLGIVELDIDTNMLG